MIAWFRRKRPVPPTNPVLAEISLTDLLVARWWNLTVDEWNRRPEADRARMRDQVVYAVRRPK